MSTWEAARVGDIAQLINGDRGKNYPSARHRALSGIPFINAGHLAGGRVRRDGMDFIPLERYGLLSSGKVEDGDVLLCIRGSVGRWALVTPDVVPGAIASSLVILRPGPLVLPRFLSYYVASPVGSRLIAASNNGAAQPNVGAQQVAALPIHLPPIEDQERIVAVLGAIDDLIENNRRRVEVMEEMARAIYREWFLKFRYPGHRDVPLVDSDLGPIPEGWDHRKLFDAADVGFGFSFKSPQFSTKGRNQVVRIRDIPRGISRTFTDEAASARYAVFDDDVLVGMDGDFHMTVWTGGDAWLNQRVTRLRSRAGMSSLQLLLSLEDQIVAWNKAIVGTTVAHLGRKHLELVTVLVPDASTLARANAVFQPMMEQRRSLIQAGRRLEALRDLLLPRLISGQIDVSTLDLDALIVERVA